MRSKIGGALLIWSLVAGAAVEAQSNSNVLILIADDVGVDALASYAEGSDFPITPNLDALTQQGILFRNAYGNPLCSPTRAAILTGRYGFRTGIGENVALTGAALPLAEITLPEMLDLGSGLYSHAAIGKWHLGNGSVGGSLAPNNAGFSHYDGCLRGQLLPAPYNFYYWPRTVNGSTQINTTYATTATVNAALEWINTHAEPWVCYVSFNAANAPFQAPPAGLYYEDLTGIDPLTNPRPFYKASIEAMDTEIGRLFAALGSKLQNTLVVFTGDNGPAPKLTTLHPPSHVKGTVFEGGINVPLLVSGPQVDVPGTECAGLVNTLDLYATVAELAGVDLAQTHAGVPLDSVSLVPYFTDSQQASLRWFTFSERFLPLGAKGTHVTQNRRAIREARYKLIRVNSVYSFYDLWNDPFEQTDLVGSLTTEQQEIFDLLKQQLLSMIRNP